MLATTPSVDSSLDNSQIKRKRSPSPLKHLSVAVVEREKEPSISAQQSKRPRLSQIEIPVSLNSGLEDVEYSPQSCSSLFSATDTDTFFDDIDVIDNLPIPLEDDTLALRTAPPIPGLFFDPSVIIPQEIGDSIVSFCMKTYFSSPTANQVMLFGRFLPPESSDTTTSGLPVILLDLLDTLSTHLHPFIPPDTHNILFPVQPTRARQAIINLYEPGEGITPHVDLLGRYDDGIVGVSFSSSCVMRFDKVGRADALEDDKDTRWDLYLPERSVVVLTKEARYQWTHGIDKKFRDFVSPANPKDAVGSEGTWIDRGVRMSITFRWLLPGADVVGEEVDA